MNATGKDLDVLEVKVMHQLTCTMSMIIHHDSSVPGEYYVERALIVVISRYSTMTDQPYSMFLSSKPFCKS
jgi:hypothetical protein